MPDKNLLCSPEMDALIIEARKRIEQTMQDCLVDKPEQPGFQVDIDIKTGEIDDIALTLAKAEDMKYKLANIAETLAILGEIQKATRGE